MIEIDYSRISASQISTFRDCQIKWHYEKVIGQTRPAGDAANLGTDIHTEMENWYRHGIVPTLKEALALLEVAPTRSPDLEPEGDIDFWLDPTVPARVKGYSDLRRFHPDRPKVWDWKSTSSIARYAKSEADLITDPQMVIYGLGTRLDCEHRFGTFPAVVDLALVYVQTKSSKAKTPETKVVPIRQTLTILEDGFDKLRPALIGIKALDSIDIPEADIPGPTNKDACYKYGGCPFRESCLWYNRTRSAPKPAHVEPTQEETRMNLKLIAAAKAKMAAAQATKPAPEPTPKAELAPPPSGAVEPSPEPDGMPLIDTSKVDDSVQVNVTPPEAAPDVTPEDPPVPVEPAPKAKAKPTKSAPKADLVAVVCPNPDPLLHARDLIAGVAVDRIQKRDHAGSEMALEILRLIDAIGEE